MQNNEINSALEKIKVILEQQTSRVEKINHADAFMDYQKISPIIIGICPGDGIGPEICSQAESILKTLLADEIKQNKIFLKEINGLTLENRIKHLKAIPDDVLAELKSCHVILKGPTTTPQKGSGMPNIESANVAMRRELDLFANVRPVRIPELNIDWCFFRENTEDLYILGSQGFEVNPNLAIDFKIISKPGSERLLRLAFEFAKNNQKKQVTIVTKSNVVKTTDGLFSHTAKEIAKEYAQFGINLDEWYIDIMTAKLLDPARRSAFQVIALPNLYGDILTDEAAQIQGGVGTAGSANIGKKWAMFEAIHGSAPRMVTEGRAKFADPSSMIKATAMLLQHIGKIDQALKLEKALDTCGQFEKKISITGRPDGATATEYKDYILATLKNPNLR